MPTSPPDQAKAARQQAGQGAVMAGSVPHQATGSPVVGIGASAGGLEACAKLLDALPADSGMTFILVQHLDPSHKSMMVELLASHTAMTVLQATDGMPVEPDHVYVIPPGTYLAASSGGALRLTPPQARHGARLPFDFLLRSLAEEYGARAACVVLSGTGADGSIGLKAIRERSGLVIAQAPEEAGYDGMPRSAIMTGAVDMVLPVAGIPAALIDRNRQWLLSGSGVLVWTIGRVRQQEHPAGLCRVGARCARTGRSRGRGAACPARGPGAGATRSAAATKSLPWC